MNKMAFTAERGVRTILILLSIHTLFSLVLIFYPSVSMGGLSNVYKRYLLPGPFFTAERIEQSNLLLISWKQGEQWTTPVNPSLTQYKNYFLHLNPAMHYRSSFERDIYEKALFMDSTAMDSALDKVKFLQSYLINHYVPLDVASVKLTLIKQVRKDFETQVDTLQIIIF